MFTILSEPNVAHFARRFKKSHVALGILLLVLMSLINTSQAKAATAPVLLNTTDSFALLAGTTITDTGFSQIYGNAGLHPGPAISGFAVGAIHGATHVSDAVALQAKTDLVAVYDDAAGRANTATLTPAIGAGQTLTSGVYRTGGVPTLNLDGSLILDGEGDPNAVFIFQIASELITGTDSSISFINGAQSCNVFWQVGSSATIGTRTAFKGNVLALTSISLQDAAVVDGRLMARNGAITLINNTVTRSTCAAGPVPDGEGTGGGTTGGEGTGGGSTNNEGPDADDSAGSGPGIPVVIDRRPPTIFVFGPPDVFGNPRYTDCQENAFSARVRVYDSSKLRSLKVYVDNRLVRQTTLKKFSLTIRVKGLKVGAHTFKVVATDRQGNKKIITRKFKRCALAAAVPQFTG